jgi:hypothetical protein
MNGTRPLPGYLLERLAAGDLPAAEAHAARERLAAEPGGEARLEALRREDRALRETLPPLRAPVAVRPVRRPLLLLAPAMAAVVAGGLLVVVGRGPTAPLLAGEEEVRVKGLAPRLVLHRKVAGGAEELGPRATARGGDLLQLGLVSAGRGYGVVLSFDGRGTLTRHLPETGERAVRLPPSGEALLPASFRLDDAPGFERFLLVVSREEFPVARAVEAARALAARPDAAVAPVVLEGGLEAASALVRKEER